MMNEKHKAALASVAATAGRSADGRPSAFAELITESINPNHVTLGILDAFMNTRALKAGDVLTKRVRTGVPVYTMVPGTRHMASQVFARDVMTYALDTIIAKIQYDWYQVQSGEIADISELRQEMSSALIDEVVSRAFTMLSTVWTPYTNSVTGSHYYNATGGLTESILTNGMEKVVTHAGSIRSIVGSRAALLPIYNTLGIVDHVHSSDSSTKTTIGIESILSDWKRNGVVSTFKGVRLIELPQVFKNTADGYYDKLIPDDYVIIIGDNAGEFITYGDVMSQENTDMSIEPPVYTLALWRQYGMIVDYPERIAVIKVPSASYSWT